MDRTGLCDVGIEENVIYVKIFPGEFQYALIKGDIDEEKEKTLCESHVLRDKR